MTPLELAQDVVRREDDLGRIAGFVTIARALIESEQKLAAAQERLRETAQVLVEAIGSNGPVNAEDMARRTASTLDTAREQRDASEAKLAAAQAALVAVAPLDLDAPCPSCFRTDAEERAGYGRAGCSETARRLAALDALANGTAALSAREATAREEGATAMREAAVKALVDSGDGPGMCAACVRDAVHTVATLPTNGIRTTLTNSIPMPTNGGR